MKIAAAAYSMSELDSFEAYADKIESWVREAAKAGADLAVFPEYGAMELATISGRGADLRASIRAVSDLMTEANAYLAQLAATYGLHILGASGPVLEDSKAVNRAQLFAPQGQTHAQDKQIMTQFERAPWGIQTGGPLQVIDTTLGRIGILICYDVEFPLLARALAEAGAELLLVPSCTDTLHGWNRVRIGARARALENQCIVVQAVTVGSCPWSPAVDENRGAAGIFGPPDLGFPDDGVIARGALDTPGWVCAEVNLTDVASVRASGAQRNFEHWREQGTCAAAVTKARIR